MPLVLICLSKSLKLRTHVNNCFVCISSPFFPSYVLFCNFFSISNFIELIQTPLLHEKSPPANHTIIHMYNDLWVFVDFSLPLLVPSRMFYHVYNH